MGDNGKSGSSDSGFDELVRSLFAIEVIKFGEFRLKSGIVSPFYFDMRCVISHPSILKAMADLYIEKCRGLAFTRIAGIPFTGLPIATAISLKADYPMVFGRGEAKRHGVSRQVEGSFDEGERVLVVDDVITDGGSKLEYVDILVDNGLVVRDIVVFLDREQGGRGNMQKRGITLHAVCTVTRLLESLRRTGCIDEDRNQLVRDFLRQQR